MKPITKEEARRGIEEMGRIQETHPPTSREWIRASRIIFQLGTILNLDLKTLKVGDPVFLTDRAGLFARGVVVKITPSGCIDVRNGDFVTRYNFDGRKRGMEKWDYDVIDVRMTFAAREEWLKKQGRAKAAAALVNGIKNVAPLCDYRLGAEALTKELDRLQSLVFAARKAVDEIDNPPLSREEEMARFVEERRPLEELAVLGRVAVDEKEKSDVEE